MRSAVALRQVQTKQGQEDLRKEVEGQRVAENDAGKTKMLFGQAAAWLLGPLVNEVEVEEKQLVASPQPWRERRSEYTQLGHFFHT